MPDVTSAEPGAQPQDVLVAPSVPIDLTNCDREPIHVPGAVQPYGVLLSLQAPALKILQISASAVAMLGHRPADVLGRTLRDVLGESIETDVRRMLLASSGRSDSRVSVSVNGAPSLFDAIVYQSEGIVILELEPAIAAEHLTVDRISAVMRATVQKLERAESLRELAQGVASELRDLTGFDRVWVYRFHPDWHGEIIGEAKRPDIETWIGMHYPASDIPAQARALFLRNWLRVIPDVAFVPSSLVPVDNPLTGAPLDLGGSLLRSVSPIHVQYLRNMGVKASLVISLIHRGKLWGLISGHHYAGPKRISFAERSLCEFLAQALSLQIGVTDRLDERAYALEIQTHQSRLVEQLGSNDGIRAALMGSAVTMLDLVTADGGLYVHDGEIARLGVTPVEPELAVLVDWLRARKDDFYETTSLAADFPTAASYVAIASGVLSLPLTRDRRDLLVWFRGELRQTVRWAGDPRKPVTIAPDGSARLHPRGSFELWEELSRGTSRPWLPIERDAALDLRRALLDRQIRHAEHTAALNEELLASNIQLEEIAAELQAHALELARQREHREMLHAREREARTEAERANRAKADFLTVMSHELRTPLNAIGGYAQLISLGIRGAVTPEQHADLERIQVNQRHLLGLINSILNFTKLEAGQIVITPTVVRVADVLAGVDALVGPQMRAKQLTFNVRECAPDITVHADEEKLRQILINLLTNALKFTAAGEVSIWCEAHDATATISVSDTGRGIATAQVLTVFEPFVQIDRHVTPEHEQGVGLGLAISRELARAMQGELSVASIVGEGSTFMLTLPRIASV